MKANKVILCISSCIILIAVCSLLVVLVFKSKISESILNIYFNIIISILITEIGTFIGSTVYYFEEKKRKYYFLRPKIMLLYSNISVLRRWIESNSSMRDTQLFISSITERTDDILTKFEDYISICSDITYILSNKFLCKINNKDNQLRQSLNSFNRYIFNYTDIMFEVRNCGLIYLNSTNEDELKRIQLLFTSKYDQMTELMDKTNALEPEYSNLIKAFDSVC